MGTRPAQIRYQCTEKCLGNNTPLVEWVYWRCGSILRLLLSIMKVTGRNELYKWCRPFLQVGRSWLGKPSQLIIKAMSLRVKDRLRNGGNRWEIIQFILWNNLSSIYDLWSLEDNKIGKQRCLRWFQNIAVIIVSMCPVQGRDMFTDVYIQRRYIFSVPKSWHCRSGLLWIWSQYVYGAN